MLSTDMRYFLAVADAGSLSGASQSLFVAVSAISRQIHRLEERIGVPLFERHARGMTLNEAGRMLERQVRKSVMDMDLLMAEIVGSNTQKQTVIHIACTEGMSFDTLPTLLARFQQQQPHIAFQLHVGTGQQVSQWVRLGKVDVALQFSMAPEAGVEVLLSLPAPLLMLMSHQHSALGTSLGPQQLTAFPLALPGTGTTLRQLFDLSCRMEGVFPEPLLSCDNFTSLYHYILTMPESMAACSFYSVMYKLQHAPIALKALEARVPAERFLQIQQQENRQPSADVVGFIRFMIGQFRQQQIFSEQHSIQGELRGQASAG
ncbi:LysR family transcriptional regulator [Candidatus Pantoea multigeneris]|uniref:LysR family transcriptional regulator n=1 Tax=Candidatus Pantoea multigeneris TaxID=2608357 RepID=A0ABX0RBP4_9GAMM|nr:LysR family transcriptional regulator [Pantoea multigeneris]NIF20665.1 LysR family transcriptional regulator [Pantoea multigeneris]